MEQYQVERIFAEKMSGKNTNRPELKAMLEYVREGDTLYIESISRLGRSMRDLLNIIDVLQQWKSGAITAVWFQKEMGLRANTFYRRLKEYKRKFT